MATSNAPPFNQATPAEAGAQAPREMVAVTSSMVDAVGYDETQGELLVEYSSGSVYGYPVSREVYEDLLTAPSVGRYVLESLHALDFRRY